jgi:multiple sugar transport system substrate-binding protein
MPDIIQIGGAEFRQYNENGLLLDLTDYVKNKSIDLSEAPKDVQTLGELDGEIIGIPTAVASPTFIYDKAITDKAGVTITNDMTIEQFEAAAKIINEKTGYKTNMYYLRPYEVMQYMMRGRGKSLFDGNKLGVTTDDLESYFQIYEDGISQGWHMVPEDFASLSIGSVEQDPLVYGNDPSKKSWCTFDNSSTYSSFTAVAGDDQDLELAPWPSENVKKSEFMNYSQLWVISKKCKNPELAAKWINEFVNSEESNKIRLTDRGMPISTSIVKTITPLLSESDQKVADYISNVITPNSSKAEQIDPASASPLKTDTLPQIEEQLLYGKITSKEAAEQFYKQANEVLASGK